MGSSKAFIFVFLLFAVMTIAKIFFGGSGGGVWNIIQIFFVMYGLYMSLSPKYTKIFLNLSRPLKVLGFFSFFIWGLAIFSSKIETAEGLYYWIVIPFAFFLSVVMYKLSRTCSKFNLRYLYLLFFYLTAFSIFYKGNSLYSNDERFMGINAYFLICLLPMAMLLHSKKFYFLPFVTALAGVIFTSKRSGFVALIAMLLYFLFDRGIKQKRIFSSIFFLLIVGVASYYAYIFVLDTYNHDIIARVDMLENDGGSGRDILWNLALNGISNSSIIELLVGHGYNSIGNILRGHDAHNDFLQIAYDYGIFASFMYIVFYLTSIIELKKMYSVKYQFAPYYALCIISSLFLSFFSFFIIEPRFVGCSAFVWSIILEDWESFKKTGESKLSLC